MKRLLIVMLGTMLLVSGASYAGGPKGKCSVSVKQAKQCVKKSKVSPAEKAKRYEKYAASYDKRAAKLEAAGKPAAAKALKKKAEAKRMMAKAFISGDKKALADARKLYREAKQEFKATDIGQADAKKYAEKYAKRKAKLAAKKAQLVK